MLTPFDFMGSGDENRLHLVEHDRPSKSIFSNITQEPWLTTATKDNFVFYAHDILSLFVIGPNKTDFVTSPLPPIINPLPVLIPQP